MVSYILARMKATVFEPPVLGRKDVVQHQLFSGPMVATVGCIAGVAIASASGILPAVYGTVIASSVSFCVVNEIVKAIYRAVKGFFSPTAEYDELSKKSAEFVKYDPVVMTIIGAPISEFLTRKLVFPFSKYMFLALGSQGTVACAVASLFTSFLEGSVSAIKEDWIEGLSTFAASRLVVFPAYFAGGLPASIVAVGVCYLISTVIDRRRYLTIAS